MVAITLVLSLKAQAQNFNSANAFEILGVSKTAPIAEIKSKFRRLSRDHYPKAPDALTPAELEEATRKFRLIRAAYDAIDQLDERIIRGAVDGGHLGLNKQEFLQRGGSPSRANELYGPDSFGGAQRSSWENQTDANWSESFFSDLHRRAQNAKATESQVRDVKTYAGIFSGEIRHIYGNASGVIIEAQVFFNRRGNIKFFWLPSDSNVIYPIIFRGNGISSFSREDSGDIYDPRLPTGQTRIVYRPGEEIRMRSHVFKSLPVFDSAQINEKLAKAGYQIFEDWAATTYFYDNQVDEATNENLNLFDYSIFFDGQQYTVILETTGVRGKVYIEAYQGFPGNMQSIGLTYKKDRRKILNQGLRQIWEYSTAMDPQPIFDENLGMFIGRYSSSPSDLNIYQDNGPNQSGTLIRSIPRLPPEQLHELNLPQLLGKKVKLPIHIRTPLDREFIRAQKEKAARAEARQIPAQGITAHAPTPSATSSQLVETVNSQDGSSARADMTKADPSEIKRIMELKRRFSKIGKFLDYPEDDVRQLVARYLLSGKIRIEEIQAIIQSQGHNADVMSLMIYFVEQLQNWDVVKHFLFIFHRNIDLHISNQGQMMVMASIHLRDLILRAPNPYDPTILAIVERIKLPYPLLMSYIEEAWRKRRQGYLPPPPQERLTVDQEWIAISGCLGLLN